MNLYVIGIGGTGSRIIRALTHLLASGCSTNNYTIVPIIIDIDDNNSDTKRALTELLTYYNFRNSFNQTLFSHKAALNWHTNIETIAEDNFKFKLANDFNITFKSYIDFDQLNELDKSFILSIFSDSNIEKEKELNLNLNAGFKGKPNLGSLVFNELNTRLEANEVGTKFLNILNNAAANENKIILVGSIFGGTGSSGMPQIIQILEDKIINNIEGDNKINSTPLGAVYVYPYYKIEASDALNDEIRSARFMTKTKTALKYYKDFSRVDSIYHLADERLQSFQYNPGGIEQRNDAIWIELIGATAIIDFCFNGDRASANNNRKNYAFFSEELATMDNKNNNDINYNSFNTSHKENIITYIHKYGLVWFFFNTFLRELNDRHPFFNNVINQNSEVINNIITRLNTFKLYFEELQSTERNFNLFNFNAINANDFILNVKTLSNTFNTASTTTFYNSNANNINARTNINEKVLKTVEEFINYIY